MLATAAPNKLNDHNMLPRATGEGRVGASSATMGERHLSQGAGTRVSDAFPASVESRNRLLSATADGNIVTANVISAIESDIALCIAVLRIANTREYGCSHVETAVNAVGLLRPRTIQAFASRVHTFDFFERVGVWDTAPERFRLHALATQRAADRIASERRAGRQGHGGGGCGDGDRGAGRRHQVWLILVGWCLRCSSLRCVWSWRALLAGCLLGEQRVGGLTGVSAVSLENQGVGRGVPHGCEYLLWA